MHGQFFFRKNVLHNAALSGFLNRQSFMFDECERLQRCVCWEFPRLTDLHDALTVQLHVKRWMNHQHCQRLLCQTHL